MRSAPAPLTLAIVGRPNVGKSTLFNRLAGKKLAIVGDTPGVTRDRASVDTEIGGIKLRLIDTAGFEHGPVESLQARMIAQTEKAIAAADVLLFVIDAREGVTPGDEIVAGALRRKSKPVLLAANKSEGRAALPGAAEAYRLGFGDPIAMSAEHGLGLEELFDALLPFTDSETREAESGQDTADDEKAARPLRLAIVGRPNVGKSSLLNRLIGEERALTSPEAGTTRDAVAAAWQWDGRDILLHDTAGLRRRARIEEALEKLSVESTLNAIRFADCVILTIDAMQPFEKQDLTIADLVSREGRAIVFAINKWDLVEERQRMLGELREKLDRLLPQVAGAHMVVLSAATGQGVERLMPAVMDADRIWNSRVPTGELNRFLKQALSRQPPPAVRGRNIKLRYMTQAKARPPSFVLFGNQLNALPESYLRYLANSLRKQFGLTGTPLRFSVRTSKNPYAD
jgi:GTP-binding protein